MLSLVVPLQPAASLTQASQADDLLPDLVPYQAGLVNNSLKRRRGRTYLRFPTMLINVGEGPLEVIGRREGTQMLAYQVLYQRAAPSREVSIGAFEYHNTHHHWHLLRTAAYRLLDADDRVVATSGKISFCLEDTDLMHPNLPGTPPRPIYGHCETRKRAKRLHSGISVGWGDNYSAATPGQEIDVTSLPAGLYTLQIELNPDGIMRERDIGNNSTGWLIDLPGPR